MPPLDYKKQDRRLYFPSAVPAVVDVPEMQFFMVDGTGDPNAPDGEYSHALELLYTLSYAVTAQDSCDMRDRLLRYFATCCQEKPLSGSLKRGEKNA